MFDINGVTYLNNRETAARLGVHPGTLRNWRCDGRSPIPFHKVGASVLYAESVVTAYLGRGKP